MLEVMVFKKTVRLEAVRDLRSDGNEAPLGPMKTSTLRSIKDSPPYLHDGRCLTLGDTTECSIASNARAAAWRYSYHLSRLPGADASYSFIERVS
jgi:hypothetical protein